MFDSLMLFIGGVLATAVVLTEPVLTTRLAVALSFGVLVGIYFFAVLPYHADEDIAREIRLDILD